jgi:3-oxoadipate enol-lactonase
MPFCTSHDIRLHYEVHGEGWPLLLISGLAGGSWSWYGQVPYFKEYYQTIIFDNRGAGLSEKPPGPYHMTHFAEDTLRLLDHLQVEQAFVLGLSMGGMIAQELGLLAPERVRALLLGCTHCGGEARIPPPPEILEKFVNNTGLTRNQAMEKNLPLFFSESCRSGKPKLIEDYCRVQIAAPQQPEYAFRAQLEAISTFDASERVHMLRMPTMIVTGSNDELVPRENSYILAQSIPDAEVVVLPGAGHALQVECCDTLNSLADNFFQRALYDSLEEMQL